jgi:arylsulfatase
VADEAAPRILIKSWMLTADIEVPEAGAEGMIATHGGLVGGNGPYVRDKKPTFVYNYLVLDRFTFASKEPLPKARCNSRSFLPTTAEADSARTRP